MTTLRGNLSVLGGILRDAPGNEQSAAEKLQLIKGLDFDRFPSHGE